jgi:dihydroxy-acid dehydratase
MASGFPVELPALSLSESYLKPTSMLYRNMLAMETEELLRSHPVDGAVLMGGCDKTTPGLLLGATSMDIPAIFVPAGPMLRGNWNGRVLGSGSDSWKYWDELRAGTITQEDWAGVERGIARSHGTCMTMGTASTMTAIIEALGLSLPGASSIPAPDANHPRMAAACGRRIVEMVWEDLTPARILAPAACANAVAVAMTMGCSTNALIHLIALARRAGHDAFGLDDFERASREVPVIANVRPSGTTHLMEDFYYAGGLRALMERIRGHLDTGALTCTGRTVGENIAGARVFDDDVIRPLDNPIYREGALAVLRGSLAPEGCVIKPSAMDPRFLRHAGPALVFDDYPSLKAAVDDEGLDVSPDHVLVLRNAGPQGGPGMPEWGMLPMPRRLLRAGHRDMLRLSDARMSGTSYGACVLHVSPESHVGGPLALLRTGDVVEVDVPARRIGMRVPDDEIARRRAAWTPPPPRFGRGYGWMFNAHIRQAHEGCDFDFLQTGFGPAVGEPAIY